MSDKIHAFVLEGVFAHLELEIRLFPVTLGLNCNRLPGHTIEHVLRVQTQTWAHSRGEVRALLSGQSGGVSALLQVSYLIYGWMHFQVEIFI